jgi:hypothetical protein
VIYLCLNKTIRMDCKEMVLHLAGIDSQRLHKQALAEIRRAELPKMKTNKICPVKGANKIEMAEMPGRNNRTQQIASENIRSNAIEVLNHSNCDPFVYHDIPGVSMISVADPTTEVLH